MLSQELPCEWKIIGTGEPIGKESLVEFRLLYVGRLLSSANSKSHADEKHSIRKFLQPQLRRLWSAKSGLGQYARYLGNQALAESGNRSSDPTVFFQAGIESLGKNWSRGSFNFVPLVTSDFALRCSLDILLLRPQGKNFIFTQGDIDGQLKTLFDALSIPENIDAANKEGPSVDENPFFVLLQNDRLISEVHVVTDELLLLPGERELKATDAFAVVHVRINHIGGSPFDRWFE